MIDMKANNQAKPAAAGSTPPLVLSLCRPAHFHSTSDLQLGHDLDIGTQPHLSKIKPEKSLRQHHIDVLLNTGGHRKPPRRIELTGEYLQNIHIKGIEIETSEPVLHNSTSQRPGQGKFDASRQKMSFVHIHSIFR